MWGAVVGMEERHPLAVGSNDGAVPARKRAHSLRRPALCRHPPHLPLLRPRIGRDVGDPPRTGRSDRRALHVEWPGREQPWRSVAGGDQVETVAVVEVPGEEDPPAVGVPDRGDLVVDPPLPVVGPHLGQLSGARLDEGERPVDGVIALPIHQELAARRPGVAEGVPPLWRPEGERMQRARLHLQQRHGAYVVDVARRRPAHLAQRRGRTEIGGNREPPHPAPVHLLHRQVLAVGRPARRQRAVPRRRPDLHVAAVVLARPPPPDRRHRHPRRAHRPSRQQSSQTSPSSSHASRRPSGIPRAPTARHRLAPGRPERLHSLQSEQSPPAT